MYMWKRISSVIIMGVLFSACTVYIHENTIFSPNKDTSHTITYPIKTSDGYILDGWVLSQPDATMNIIFFHGNAYNNRYFMSFLERVCTETKATIFTADYRGFGASEGEPTPEGIVRDGDAITSFFLDNAALIQNRPTYVVGYSMGSHCALRAAHDPRIKGVVLISGFSNPADMKKHLKKQAPWYARYFLRFKPDTSLVSFFDNEQLVRTIHKPIIFLHGKKDTTLPYKMSLSLYTQCPSTQKHLFFDNNAGHGLNEEYATQVIAALKTLENYDTKTIR